MLRDKFAMAAMQGMLAAGMQDRDFIAEHAYKMAQAMLDEREQWDFDDDPENNDDDQYERIPHGVKVVEMETSRSCGTAGALWAEAFKHHEATQGKAVPPDVERPPIKPEWP